MFHVRAFARPLALLPLVMLAALAPTAQVQAAKIVTLAAFSDGTPGLLSGVALGAEGLLFGTLANGGAAKAGSVYAVSRLGGLTTLASFLGGSDGDSPQGTLLASKSGAVIGTTAGGATGHGTVFMLTPPAPASDEAPATAWTRTTLYSFSGPDGANPASGVIAGPDGTLYGTAINGGAASLGAVYALSPPATPGGAWQFSLLHSFTGDPDGAAPNGPLLMDNHGALFGTTLSGGTGAGTVFELAAPASPGAARAFTVLHAFAGAPLDGDGPFAGLAIGKTGTLFGTTEFGGATDHGCVFAIAPANTRSAARTASLLYSFTGADDGGTPIAPVTLDPRGWVYGTTLTGGAAAVGTVFSLKPPALPATAWVQNTLISFPNSSGVGPGSLPAAGLLRIGGGLYTVTTEGAANGGGAVVRITQ
jgi:uncharacterized repeat protein (TIGR03803 family)